MKDDLEEEIFNESDTSSVKRLKVKKKKEDRRLK